MLLRTGAPCLTSREGAAIAVVDGVRLSVPSVAVVVHCPKEHYVIPVAKPNLKFPRPLH